MNEAAKNSHPEVSVTAHQSTEDYTDTHSADLPEIAPVIPAGLVAGTQLAVVGGGFVGLVAAAGFAHFGHSVVCVERDPTRLQLLKDGRVPFFEQDLDPLLKRYVDAGRISFTNAPGPATSGCKAIFLAVGTPSRPDGRSDVDALLDAVGDMAPHLRDGQIIVIKSTVPVGTAARVREVLKSKGAPSGVRVVSNPEFLREGSAVKDFFHPQRIVVGGDDPAAVETVTHIYRIGMRHPVPFVITNNETAEMIKYASNAFIALKVGFANELAGLCDLLKVNVLEVARAMGMDPRIGSEYLVPGPGWGGSCLGKDLRELTGLARAADYRATISSAILEANSDHQRFVVEKILRHIGGAKDARVGVLGLAFKAGTSDVRESPSLAVIRQLIDRGVSVVAYDPRANGEAVREIPELKVVESALEAARDAHCLVVLTEWQEFQALDLAQMARIMSKPVLMDTRNLLVPETVIRHGFTYDSMGQS